jgi:hypothetical protein
MDQHTPDPKAHKQISLIKSGIRILAGIAFCFGGISIGGFLLIIAEAAGIAEELV